jgi:hypothetical protein
MNLNILLIMSTAENEENTNDDERAFALLEGEFDQSPESIQLK